MEFKDQYKHPNWQKKRLESLNDAGFKCQCCGATEAQLHVHHKQYIKGRRIWEYELPDFEVLCDGCHLMAHEYKDALCGMVASIPSSEVLHVIGLVAGFLKAAEGRVHSDTENIMKYAIACNGEPSVVAGAVAAEIINRANTEAAKGLYKALVYARNNGVSLTYAVNGEPS